MADGVTVANAFVQVMPSMEGATSNLTNALVPSLGNAGTQAGEKFGSLFTGKAGALLKAGAGVLAGAFAVGAIKDAYVEVEAGFNKVKLATGATGEAAEQLKSVYLEVSKSVSGSFEDIGSTVGELNTRLGLTGGELEEATEAMMKYAKVTGQDATSATKDVASMMRNVGIPTSELANTLGKLTVAGQAAGVDVSSLANNVTKYNAVMKQLGLTTDEQIALMSKFEVSGADTASILNAMKKGVASWAKEGKDARTEFKNFVEGVQNGTVTAGDAVEIFGTKGGLSMFEAAQKGQLAFEDMYDAISNASAQNLDTIYQDTLTAEEKFDILGKNLQAGFFEILEPIIDALMPYVDMAIQGVTDLINGAVEAITPFAESFAATIGPIIDEVLPQLQEEFNSVMTDIQGITEEVWPVVQEIITGVMDTVGPLLKEAWPVIKEIIHNAMVGVKVVIQTVWPIVKNTISTSVEVIKGVIGGLESIVGTVSGIFDGVRSAIEDPIGTAKNAVSGFVDEVLGFFSGLGDRITNAIGSIHFPSPSIWWENLEVGPAVIPIPHVDWYATGGFADSATLAGYGEKGLELYWPGYAPYFDKYAQAIAEHMPNGGRGIDIHDCTFNVRKDSDIRAVAVELNTLINRQTAGGLA